MAKKAASSPSKKSTPAAAPKAAPAKIAAPVVATSPVRNSPVPKAAPKVATAKKEITHSDIARRAYEIYTSGTGGSEMDNWCRAERELRAGL